MKALRWEPRTAAGLAAIAVVAAAAALGVYYLSIPACDDAWVLSSLDRLINAEATQQVRTLGDSATIGIAPGERRCRATRHGGEGGDADLRYRVFRSGLIAMVQITAVVPARPTVALPPSEGKSPAPARSP